MWFLLLLCLPFVRAEWPPSTCDSPVAKKGGSVQLTPVVASTQEASCTCKEPWSVGELYLQIERGSPQKAKLAKPSVLDIQFRDASTTLFRLDVEDQRLKVTGTLDGVIDCPGAFVGDPFWIRIRLDRWTNGTSVSVSYRTGDAFMSCGRFELAGQVRALWTDMHGQSGSGQVQKVLSIQTASPEIKKKVSVVQPHALRQDVDALQKRLETHAGVIDDLSDVVEDTTVKELADLKTYVAHVERRMYIGFGGLAVLILASLAMLIRTSRRDRIHLL